jgi:hypothetical protein
VDRVESFVGAQHRGEELASYGLGLVVVPGFPFLLSSLDPDWLPLIEGGHNMALNNHPRFHLRTGSS